MKIKALKSFSGLLSMVENEVIEYDDKTILDDLLSNRYVEEVAKTKKAVKKNENK